MIITDLQPELVVVLIYEPFVWTVDTVGLLMVFGKDNMAVVSAEVFSKMTAIWRAVYCHINPSPLPLKKISDSSSEKPVVGTKISLMLILNNIFTVKNNFF